VGEERVRSGCTGEERVRSGCTGGGVGVSGSEC
jgi:hypothetical protein